MIKMLLCLFLSLAYLGIAAAQNPERRVLEIGDLSSLTIPAGASLHLSQKKIVEVQEAGANRYQLIALHSGIVYVRALDAQGQVLEAWVIEVLTRASEDRADIFRHPRWRSMLCKEVGIDCDSGTDTLRGQTESLPWLHRARDLCQRHPPCRWEARLSSSAQELWGLQLAKELNVPKVTVGADGFVSLAIDCQNPDRKREDQLSHWLKDRYGAPAQLVCQLSSNDTFSLDVLAIAYKSSDASLNNPLQLGTWRLSPSQPLEVFLHGLSQHSDTKILAKPQIALNLGSQIELSDGMEIASTTMQKDQTIESWKNVGFNLQLKLIEQHEQRVKVQVILQLSRPHEGQRALDRSTLQTETWIDLQQLQLIGHIEAQTDGLEESSIPWLGSIPFLGGLFRWKIESVGKSQVYLLLRLKPQKLLDPSPLELQEASPQSRS